MRIPEKRDISIRENPDIDVVFGTFTHFRKGTYPKPHPAQGAKEREEIYATDHRQ
jgi:hypothetical protein